MKIYQIEISNKCNLACSYCPHPTQRRPQGLMSRETFEKSVELLIRCGQRTAYLHNFGEPLLHPEVDQFVRHCTERGVPRASSRTVYWSQLKRWRPYQTQDCGSSTFQSTLRARRPEYVM